MDNFLTTLAEYFQAGGYFMWPLVGVLILGLAIAIERIVFVVGARGRNRRFWNQVQPLLEKSDYRAAEKLTNDSDTAISRILTYGLNRLSSSTNRSDIETAMEEGLMEQMPRLERRTHYLATLANIATLLGLLGTIWGMIGAFDAIALADETAKATTLGNKIGEAMLTTAFGLIIAIPLLLIHAWLQSRTTEMIDGLEMAVVKFLNAIKR